MERRLANEEITLASLKCPPNLMKAGEVRKSGEGRNCLRSAPAMPVCRNPPPDFLLYRRRDARTACALNQGLRSLSLAPEWFSSFPLVEGWNRGEW